MIRRLVKMTFREDALEEFQSLFANSKDKIRSFDGCEHLELWQDENDPCIFFTYSHWKGAEFLDHYRQSELFAEVWAKTKALFDGRPEAWSTELKAEGEDNKPQSV